MESFAGFSESGSMECPPALHCDTFRPENTGEHRAGEEASQAAKLLRNCPCALHQDKH